MHIPTTKTSERKLYNDVEVSLEFWFEGDDAVIILFKKKISGSNDGSTTNYRVTV